MVRGRKVAPSFGGDGRARRRHGWLGRQNSNRNILPNFTRPKYSESYFLRLGNSRLRQYFARGAEIFSDRREQYSGGRVELRQKLGRLVFDAIFVKRAADRVDLDFVQRAAVEDHQLVLPAHAVVELQLEG